MNQAKFFGILNKHILYGDGRKLLEKIADRPERFVGLFRPTKPKAKIFQYLLQSHEIRFGDAMEEVLSSFLEHWGFKVLPNVIKSKEGKLDIDQYFKNDQGYYFFIEQKMRDDHDSTKKSGQIRNFERKLELLYNKHVIAGNQLEGIMYFFDPSMTKNKEYYQGELKEMGEIYEGVRLELFYGKELFEGFSRPKDWDNMLSWLEEWKRSLPDFPEVDLDRDPEKNATEIAEMRVGLWRRLVTNDEIWKSGIMHIVSRRGKTLEMVAEIFAKKKGDPARIKIAELIQEKLKQHYRS